ncbi:homeobox protein NANOG-like [Emydura macquarii macquarii]|uniref:homeobox protein NANOG-like n=1 Tax=Emydura macquarii macquarii TaxID=1129001 RepID=UPI00352B0FD9
MEMSAPELQEAFAAMTPALWDLIPLVPDPAHCSSSSSSSSSSGGGSQPLSRGPWDSTGGLVASVGTGLHDPARMDSREGAMALPRVPATAAGTHVVAAAPSRASPHGQWAGQPERRRKKRNLYSWNQLRILESFFHREKYPSPAQAEMLSGMTGLTYQQIRTWFQNRRGKHRRLCSGNGTLGSSLCILQVQSMEPLELAQLINAGDSLLTSFCMDSQRNPPCEPNYGDMPALVRHWE